MRISVLIIIMTLTCSSASADKYSRAWKKVEEFIEKDLPESAAKEINNIWDMAAKDNDGRQMLKSAVYLTRVQQVYNESSLLEGIELFKTLLPKLKVQEHKALCHAFLAEGYNRYWESNEYALQRNRPTDDPNPTIDRWTLKMVIDTICFHLDQSIELAGDVAAGYYEEFFPGGNKAGLKLRPNLADMLMDNAIKDLSPDRLTKSKRAFLDDPRLYGSASEFISAANRLEIEDEPDSDLWQFHILRRLTLHNMLSKPSIRTTIDLRRMSILADVLDCNFDEWNQNYDALIQGCLDLAQEYEKKVKFSTLFYSLAASFIEYHIGEIPDDDLDKQVSMRRLEHDICMRAGKKWPKSEGAIECLNLLARMEQKSISLTRNGDLAAGERNIAMITYANIKSAYFKIVEVTSEIKGKPNDYIVADLNAITPVVEWSMSLTGPNDWLKHYALVDIPPVIQGNYYLMASTGPYFGQNDQVSFQYLECSNIGLAYMKGNDGSLSGYAVNLKTGKPISCRYTLWTTNINGDLQKIATQGFTADDGFLSLERLARGYYRVELEQGENKGNASFNIPYMSDMPDRSFIQIFTDRYTYLPGDSVQFTGVFYRGDGYDRGKVLKNTYVNVHLRDLNYKDIEELHLITDSLGVVQGTFHIPENIVPGHASILASGDHNEYSSYHQINIESFRQPKFDVKLDKLTFVPQFDRQFEITGSAVSLTDVPVDGAQVSWKAVVTTNSFHPFLVRDDNGNVNIGSGETVTASDGTFSIPITVNSEMMIYDQCHVILTVTVTDVNGETHDRNLGFGIGYESYINVWAQHFFDESGTGLDIDLSLVNGSPIDGTVHLKVSKAEMAPCLLPLPFSVAETRMIKEIEKIVDDQNYRERFKRYSFDFQEKYQVENLIYDQDLNVTAADGAHVRLTNLESGTYTIRANTADGASYYDVRVLARRDDNTFVPNSELLWCFDTKPEAAVGDTVDFKITSSLPNAIVYWMIENRFGMYDRGYINTNGKQQTLTIPITDELRGSFGLSLALAYEGYTENLDMHIDVRDRIRELDLELVTFRDLLEPDTPEEWTLRVTDHEGNPVQAAVMIDMYDSALEKYGSNRWQFSPWNSIYVSPDALFSTNWRRVSSMLPQSGRTSQLEYKGKKAITGTLINPFAYYRKNGKGLSTGGMRLRGSSPINMSDFESLGITTVDEALQGRVAGLDIVFDSGELGARNTMQLKGLPEDVGIGTAVDVQEGSIPMAQSNIIEKTEPVGLRTDMNPTGLFEYKQTGPDGIATFNFKAPQLLTRWNLQAIAFTDSLKTGRIDRIVTTRKQLMVEPSTPRFLRQGDRMEFTVKVSNLTDKDVSAKVTLTFTDAITGKEIKMIAGLPNKTVSIPAKGNKGTSFTINVPDGLTAVTYRITAQTTGHSDGLQETIPVLSNRIQITQSLSLFNNGNEKRTFVFGELAGLRSNTIQDEKLILEYSASPIWYAIQALPSIICVNDPSNLSLFYSFMGAAISDDLGRRYPAIRQMLDEWAQLPASEWQTQLERNQKLTNTLLEETPWLRSSLRETDRMRSLARLLGTQELRETIQDALDRLRKSQRFDGGWTWLDGGLESGLSSNYSVTESIIQGMGLLVEQGVIEHSESVDHMLKKGIDFIDEYWRKNYNLEQYHPTTLTWDILRYLMTRSYYKDIPFSSNTKDSYQYYLSLIDNVDTHNMSLWMRADLALLLSRMGKDKDAEHVAQTLLERSLYSDEMGRYWRDNIGGTLLHDAPVETQSTIIRVLLATGHKVEAAEAARWLLKQKQTTGWETAPTTAAAVIALMATGADVQLESDPDITIYIGKEALQASTSKAMAGYTTHTWEGPIGRDKANITIDAKTDGISWGGIFRTFTEVVDKVDASENGFTLKRIFWRVVNADDGERLEEVKAGTALRVGDKLRVQFEISTDRVLEYIELADCRAATMEPKSTRAGYTFNWRDDISFYAAPGNTRSVFYIDRLSKGSYKLQYDVYVQKPGRFQEGIATIQCLYAPAFRATTTGAVLTVE